MKGKLVCKIDEEGNRRWYNSDGKLHREDGPAIERADGSKVWCLNGKRHREDGPAVEDAGGDKEWWLNGKLHREDGPTFEGVDGTKEWWLNGEHLTQDEHERKTRVQDR
jgi:hypothetical protein